MRKKSFISSNKKIIVPALGAVVISTSAALLVSANTPLLNLQRAYSGVSDEFITRLGTSPLQGVLPLIENLNNGTTAVAVDYTPASPWSMPFSSIVTFTSNQDDVKFSLSGNVDVEDISIDFDWLLSRESLSLRSNLLLDQYIGINFGTFNEDITEVADLFGLSQWDIEAMTSSVDYLRNALGTNVSAYEFDVTPYKVVLNDILLRSITGTTRENIDINGTSVRVDRTAITLDATDLSDLMWGWYNVLSEDALLETYATASMMTVDEFLADLHWSIEVLSEELGQLEDFSVDFNSYVTNRGRLVRTTISHQDFTNEHTYTAVLDFGNDALDTWTLTALDTVNDETSVAFSGEWTISQADTTYTNTFTNTSPYIPTFIGFGEHFRPSVVMNWESNRGAFDITARDGVDTWNILSGQYINTHGGEGFMFAADTIEIPTWRGEVDLLDLGIASFPKNEVVIEDFKNIRELTAESIDAIVTNLMSNFGF